MKYKSHLFQVYINIIKSVSKMEEQHQRVFICDESSQEKLTITLPLNNRSTAVTWSVNLFTITTRLSV